MGRRSRWTLIGVGLLLVLLALAGCARKPPQAEAPPPPAPAAPKPEAKAPEAQPAGLSAEQIEKAKKIWVERCEGCHGPTRAGATGPALLPETHGGASDEMMINTITNGREGTAMPAFKDRLSSDEIKLMVQFVKTVPPDKPPTWGLEEIEQSRKVFLTPDQLPKKPTHKHRLENIFFVVERDISKGAFIDGDTFEVIKEVPFGFAIHEIEYSHDGRFGYTVARNGQVVKFDLYALDAVAEARACLNARGVAVSDDAKYIIVGCYFPFQMVILSGEDLKPLKVIPARGANPDGKEVDSRVAAVAFSGKHKVFLAALKEAGQIWIVEPKEPDFPVTKLEKVGRVLHDFFFDESGDYWMGAAQQSGTIVVVDVKNRTIAATIPTGKQPHPGIGAFWRLNDGRQVAGTVHIGEGKLTIWEVPGWKVVGEVKLDGPGLFIKTHPKSKYVWTDVFTGENKDVIHVHEKEPPFKIVKTLKPRPGKTTIHPEFTDDGKYVLVSVWDKEGEIVVYDANTLEEVKSIKGLVTPTGKFNMGNRLHKRQVGTY